MSMCFKASHHGRPAHDTRQCDKEDKADDCASCLGIGSVPYGGVPDGNGHMVHGGRKRCENCSGSGQVPPLDRSR